MRRVRDTERREVISVSAENFWVPRCVSRPRSDRGAKTPTVKDPVWKFGMRVATIQICLLGGSMYETLNRTYDRCKSGDEVSRDN
jgi:hypothetical protein